MDHKTEAAMSLADLSDPAAVAAALDEFDELGRDEFLRRHGYGRSQSYFVERDGKLYDSKAIAGVAYSLQFPARLALGPQHFSGGDATVRRKLQDLGFSVRIQTDDLLPLQNVLEEVLALQVDWTHLNTPPMQRRGQLVRNIGPQAIRNLFPAVDTLPFQPQVQGSDGKGPKARVPWMRVYSKSKSPTAQVGWYVVYLFASDGSAVYLSLNQGTTEEGAELRSRPDDYLASRVAWARAVVGRPSARWHTEMQLADLRRLGERYEHGNVVAIKYTSGSIPADDELAAGLEEALALLTKVYAEEHPGPDGQPRDLTTISPTTQPLATRKYDFTWLREQTLWDESILKEVHDVLVGDQPHVIFAGPPGTGKTWVGRAFAEHLTENDTRRWRLIQFHPSYGYESFVEGLRPVVKDEGGIAFDVVPGIVQKLATAATLTQELHVLIIDEMNRANIPRVFGELMFLLEYRDEIIQLQYTKDFSLPREIAFIATMNTADRSIRTLDIALRRRFEVFECLPDAAILERFYEYGRGTNSVSDLSQGFVALNGALAAELDRHHTIGQTFFMARHMTPERLRRIWERKLGPLIDDYFFDMPDLAAQFQPEHFWTSLQ